MKVEVIALKDVILALYEAKQRNNELLKVLRDNCDNEDQCNDEFLEIFEFANDLICTFAQKDKELIILANLLIEKGLVED